MKSVFCLMEYRQFFGVFGRLMSFGEGGLKAHLNQTSSADRRKHGRATGLLGVIALVSVMLAANPAHAYADYGYTHESLVGYSNVDWMARVSDDTSLSRISIPGTHDTGTYEFDAIGKNPELIGYVAAIVALLASPAGPFLGPAAIAAAAVSGIALSETVMNDKTKTQSLSFDTQLASGIRAWDIRLGAKDNVFLTGKDENCTVDKLIVFHGVFKQGPHFWDVLNSASRFLNDHPSEAIVMRIRRENGCTNNFAESVRDAFARYPGLLYSDPNNANPRLGDLRGHVYVIQDFSATANSGTTLGPSWSAFAKQDDFEVTNLNTKWNAAKNFFIATNQSPNSLRFNYLSGTGPSIDPPYPYQVASGYAGQEGVNIQAARFLRSGAIRYAGIVHADFPGVALIDTIIQLNSRSLVNETIAITALVNNKRVCARRLSNDDSQLVADGQAPLGTVAACERFVVVDAGDNFVALRSPATGGYVGDPWGSTLPLVAYYPTFDPDSCFAGGYCDPLPPATRESLNNLIRSWNKFSLDYQGNGQHGLKSFVSNGYVAAESAGAAPLIANRG
ncbi:MAG: hypothetical protein JNM52_00575, partial [Betaproteobacteria bacterium]|nr:hypothetical protein [Betaproteobacteria bacterium]